MKKHLLIFTFFIALMLPSAALAQTVRITPAERRMAETIKADQLSNWLHFVASDAMAGRDTPSQGLDVTAEFLKMKLSWWKFKPAGDNGTFFQTIQMRSEIGDPSKSSLTLGRTPYRLNEEFLRISGSGSAKGDTVFAGNGWMVKSKNIDAYAGVDVKDKIVVLNGSSFPNVNNLTRRPEGVTAQDLTGVKGVDWADPLTYAASKGAAGIIIVASQELSGNWAQVRNFANREVMSMVGLRDAPPSLPVILASGGLQGNVFAGNRGTPDSATAFETGNQASIELGTTVKTRTTQNVVALWEGGDAKLKHEMVAIGSHYDHVGVNENAPGDDKIYNGADDDGSGTVAMLAIAEALAKANVRPKRSILFVWHTAEEKGLLGAEYFNKFPTVNIKDVIAQLNIDMIGRSQDPNNIIKCGNRTPCNEDLSKSNEVYVIGSEMMSSTLGAITKGTNDAFLKLDYNYRYDEPSDPNRFFFRSDHFHYAVNGIPIVFWFTGVHEDYHQPGDHADKIDYQKYERITRTIFMTAWKLAHLNERPKIDKQLPPELQSR